MLLAVETHDEGRDVDDLAADAAQTLVSHIGERDVGHAGCERTECGAA